MKLGIEDMYLNITKAIYDNPIASIILNGEKIENSSPEVRNEIRVSTFFTLIQHSFRIPSQSKRQEEEIEGIQIRKKEVKLYLSAYDKILYLKDLKKSTKKLLYIINTFSKVT
jgi:hypothetical protein